MSESKKLLEIKELKRIIIFGHNGFIGSNIITFFQKQNPNIEIIGKSFPEIDLTKEEDVFNLKNIFDMNTAIIMLSAIKPNIGNDPDAFTKNVRMVLNLCKVLQEKPVRRFIYFSSAAVYGEDVHNTSISEDTPINTRSYYGMAKYACERLLWKTFDEQENSSLFILRPTVIYGPGEKVISYNPAGFLKTILNHEKLTLWGDGTEKREFIYIDDVVRLVHYFTFHEYDGVLNLVSGKSYTFREAVDIISELVDFKINVDSRERTKNKVDNEFDNKLLVELLPNFKFTTLKEGIKKVYEYEFAKVKK